MSNLDFVKSLHREDWHVKKFDEFHVAIEKTKKECPDLSRMNEFVFMLSRFMIAFLRIPSFFDKDRNTSERYSQSLVFTCFLESLRNSYCTVYLSACGLYKNAYHNIRYELESVIQASYFDSNCPHDDFPMKIAMLEEAEDKREFNFSRLTEKLHINLGYKKETIEAIMEEWGKLSKKVHSKHYQFVATSTNFMDCGYETVYVDCEEVKSIYESMRVLHDIFSFSF